MRKSWCVEASSAAWSNGLSVSSYKPPLGRCYVCRPLCMRWTRSIPHEHNVFCSHFCVFSPMQIARKIRRHLGNGARNQLVSFLLQSYTCMVFRFQVSMIKVKGFAVYPRNETWLTWVMWPRRDVKASVTDLRWRWRHVANHVMTVGWMCMRARMAASLYVYKWSGGWRPVSHSFLQRLAGISVSVGRRQLID